MMDEEEGFLRGGRTKAVTEWNSLGRKEGMCWREWSTGKSRKEARYGTVKVTVILALMCWEGDLVRKINGGGENKSSQKVMGA